MSYVFQVLDKESGQLVGTYTDPKEAGLYASTRNCKVVKVKAGEESESQSMVAVVPNRYCQIGPRTFYEVDDPGLPGCSGVKYIPKAGVDWRNRRCRDCYEHGTDADYVHVIPWVGQTWWIESEYWTLHYPGLSSVGGHMTYVPSEEYGRHDRQVRTAPGRYLKKFFGDVLAATDIEDWALKFSVLHAPEEVRLATTADDIEAVYVGGPNSCMSGEGEWDSPIHPVRVYAGYGLAVAYLGPIHSATSRSLVWPERMIHSRIYGNELRMEDALRRAGYKYAEDRGTNSFIGAKLDLVHGPGDSIVCPYLDGAYGVDVCGDCLEMTKGSPDFWGDTTTGLVGYSGVLCERCGEYSDPDCIMVSVGGESWCESCADYHSFACDCCDERYSNEYAVSVNDGDMTYCDGCAQGYTSLCTECDERFSDDLIVPPEGEVHHALCTSCYDANTSECTECEVRYYNDDLEDGKCTSCQQITLDLEEGGEKEDAA